MSEGIRISLHHRSSTEALFLLPFMEQMPRFLDSSWTSLTCVRPRVSARGWAPMELCVMELFWSRLSWAELIMGSAPALPSRMETVLSRQSAALFWSSSLYCWGEMRPPGSWLLALWHHHTLSLLLSEQRWIIKSISCSSVVKHSCTMLSFCLI